MNKKDKDTKDTIISIRLTEADRYTLKQAKIDYGINTSKIVRKALNHFICFSATIDKKDFRERMKFYDKLNN
jgi:hypothetical protein